MWWFALLAAGLWAIQGLLGFWQLRHFNKRFTLLRSEGRVVVGKAKGRVMAGVVIMFCLDRECNIIKGEKMEGVSIFARLKPFNVFNDVNLLNIEQSTTLEWGRPTSKAVMNAVENYKAFIVQRKSDVEVMGTENEGVTV